MRCVNPVILPYPGALHGYGIKLFDTDIYLFENLLKSYAEKPTIFSRDSLFENSYEILT